MGNSEIKKTLSYIRKKKNSVLFCVLQISNAPLIPGISKWKKELIFSGVVHPAIKVCQMTEGGSILSFTEILKPQRYFNISRDYFEGNGIKTKTSVIK